MKFEFPKDRKTESVNISVYKTDIDKIRQLAEINNCSQQDIYKTLISEAIDEYEEKFGKLTGKKAEKNYSSKRDYLEAGDNRRQEINEKYPDSVQTKTEIIKDELEELEEDARLGRFHCEECSKEIYEGQIFELKDSLYCKECHEKLSKPIEEPLNKFGHKIVGWSYEFDYCQGCGSDKKKHVAKGYCWACYAKNRRSTKKLPKNWYKKDNLSPEVKGSESETVEVDEEIVFCQNANCGDSFPKKEGVTDGKFIFCSKECLDFFNSANEDDEE